MGKGMSSSNEFVLLAVDTAGIQKYIFNSNRLRENIGASYLVAAATEEWALEAVRNASGGSHNIDDNGELNDSLTIEQSGLNAEVLYAGGGNFIVLFRNRDVARAFTGFLSRRVLTKAPGLRLMIHSIPFVWGRDPLGEKLGELLREMKEKRSRQSSVMPLAGLGVTVMCRSTALPAVGPDPKSDNDELRPVSAEVLAKLDAVDDANAELRKNFPLDEYDYPLRMDDLGRERGESSLVAVVHADGDGIGKKIEAIGESYLRADQARAYITALRNFSRQLEQAAQNALQETLNRLEQAIVASPDAAELIASQRSDNNRPFLPFRPLVFGGDDVTFVCDGRIGLSLTLEYLRQFELQTELQLGERLTACAGVAIVKSHFPFARAYDLAEQLTKSAKQYKREVASGQSCIDWHFTTSGISGDLDRIRARDYETALGSLTLRPVALDGVGIRSWATVEAGLKAFQGKDWQGRRNKAKALREKLRGGPEAVREFTTIYGDTLPPIIPFKDGWTITDDGKRYCGYFDALELMDLHLPLTEQNNEIDPETDA